MVPLTVCKQVNLSVQYGNASVSPFAYANYGFLLCGVVGDIDSGYQFGQLALNFSVKVKCSRNQSQDTSDSKYIYPTLERSSERNLRTFVSVYSSGLETGDLEYAAYGLLMYSYLAYFSGKELTVLEREMAINRDAIHKIKQETPLNYIETYRQATLNLLEKVKIPTF